MRSPRDTARHAVISGSRTVRMGRRLLGGLTMRNARYGVASVVAIALTACGSARSLDGADQSGLLRDTGGSPSRPADRAARSTDPGRPSPETGPAPSTAALNSRLLEQAARSSEDTDLPMGAGDLLEISVFEVEELSKIRLRIPLRGAIS